MSSNRLRVLLVSMLAVFAVSAVASASASAANHEYFVEGVALGATETVSGTSAVSKLEAPGLITIECATDSFTGTIEPKGLSTATVKFKTCTVVGAATCKVAEPIEFTANNKLTVLLNEANVFGPGDLFEPPTGKEFVTITITGCALEGKYVAEGKQQCILPAGETELVKHEIECKPKGSEIHLKAKEAKFTSTETVELSGAKKGQKWHVKL